MSATPRIAGMAEARQTSLSENLLNSYVGEEITDICPHGFTDSSFNHCAHFVCHAMSLSVGYTCRAHSGSKDKAPGACIRVHELFAHCPRVGKLDSAPADRKATGFFAFVTAANNVKLATKTMSNVPKKHVGIYLNGTIWHYSNTKDEVVTQTPEQFINHYKGQVNGVFYGTFPAKVAAVAFE